MRHWEGLNMDELNVEVTVRLRVLDPAATVPAYAHDADAGADLCASADVQLPPLGRAVVPTGLALEIPDGWAGFVHPRSGLASKHGVTVANAPGTIDAGYRGEVRVALVNLDPVTPYTVHAGDRIAQLVVQQVARASFEQVEALAATGRSEGGFGSTGR
jgi:dUTP pyrophosphatase